MPALASGRTIGRVLIIERPLRSGCIGAAFALGLIASFCFTGHSYWPSGDGGHPPAERLLRELLVDDLVRPSVRAGDLGLVLPSGNDVPTGPAGLPPGSPALAVAFRRSRGNAVRRFAWVLLAGMALASAGLTLRALMPSATSSVAPPSDDPATEADAGNTAGMESAVETIVRAWNAAHASKDTVALGRFYAESVFYYGLQQSKETCVSGKQVFMTKSPDFSQQVMGSIQTTRQGDRVRADFVKRVRAHARTTDFISYLVFRRSNDGWQIVTEGDVITDANRARKAIETAAASATAVDGDFDGDGSRETLRVIPPRLPIVQSAGTAGECVGECDCRLAFSNDEIPPIWIKDCIGGVPVNEGDLDDDGAEEIGILPGWWTNCWHDYRVYTLKRGSWALLVTPISTHCNLLDQGVNAIEKDRNAPGHVIVRYTDASDAGLAVRSRSIKVR